MKFPRHVFFCIIFNLWATDIMHAQQKNVSFSHITLEQGLSQSTIYSIVQDRRGYLWFATEDGLNKYDGYTFTVFRYKIDDPHSLSHNYIHALYIDSRGNLWIGTQNGVLHSYNDSTETITRYDDKPMSQEVRGYYNVNAISEDGHGGMLYATANDLRRLDLKTNKITVLSSAVPSDTTVRVGGFDRILRMMNGELWISTSYGVVVYYPETRTFKPLDSVIPHPENDTHYYYAAFEDSRGKIWLRSTSGLYIYDKTGKQFTRIRLTYSTGGKNFEEVWPGSFAQDSSGLIWLGGDQGLFRYDPATEHLSHFDHAAQDPASLSDRSMLSLCVDRTGILFVGTYGGVNTYAPWQIKFKHYFSRAEDPTSLVWNNVRSLCEDREGNIWVATLRGLDRLDLKTNTFSHYGTKQGGPPYLFNDIFWSVAADRSPGRTIIYAGMNGFGIHKIEMYENSLRIKKVERVLSGNTTMMMTQDRDTILWVGAINSGVFAFDKNFKKTAEYTAGNVDSLSLSNYTAGAVCVDSGGILWVGTDNGLNKVYRTTGLVKRYFHDPKNPNSPSGANILCIHRDPDGMIWFGTYSGLNRLDPRTETFTRVTTENGLPNDVIYSILGDQKNNLWMGTNKGIVRYTPATGMVKTYTTEEGLQSYEYNQRSAMVAKDGTMYFGGVNGFNVFHPDSIIDNVNIPEIVFTDLQIFNKSVRSTVTGRALFSRLSGAKELYLDYSDDVLTFEFAALEYTNPRKNEYAYMMEGFNDDWIYAGTKREATYTNLDPGPYTFRVKASNNDGVWNDTGTSVKIFIEPPWWMTWWFRSCAVLLFLSAGPVIYFRRVRFLKRENVRQKEFSRKLIESQESERFRIARELHDGLGQDLLVVKSRAMLGLKTADPGSKEREQLQEISETIGFSIQAVREIARDLRPYQLDSLSLSEAIQATLHKVSESSGIVFTVSVDDLSGLFEKEMEVSLFRIIQETSNNIVKHSHASEATFDISRSENTLTIEIRDNGAGFDPSAAASSGKKGFGLSGIGERVRMIGGTHTIHSAPGKGTSHLITIQLTNTHNQSV